MRSTRLDRFLAGTAVALILPVTFALTASAQDAQPGTAATEASQPAAPEPLKPGTPPAEAAKSEIPTGTVEPAATTAEPSKPAKDAATETPKTGAPATAATAPSGPNTPVAEALRELSAGKFDRLIGGRGKREEIEKFYAARNYAPLWIDNGALSARAKAAAAYLAGVAADGLEPSDYRTPTAAAGATATALAEAEFVSPTPFSTSPSTPRAAASTTRAFPPISSSTSTGRSLPKC